MKIIKDDEDLFITPQKDLNSKQPIIVDTSTQQTVIDFEIDAIKTSSGESNENGKEAEEQVEAVIEEVEDELWEEPLGGGGGVPDSASQTKNEIVLQPTKEVEDDKEVSGFDQPLDTTFGIYRIPDSIEQDLNILFGSRYEYTLYLPPPVPGVVVTIDTCCVQDLPISLTFNGLLIFTGLIPRRDFTFEIVDPNAHAQLQNPTDISSGCDDCCCEVPPPPEPNYWFTYTNCDGEAYIDLFIKTFDTGTYIAIDDVPDYTISEYRIYFDPRFMPECGCDITEVFSNVINAKGIEDFTNSESEENSGHTTHFLDACGWCWSIFSENPLGDESDDEYVILPLCVQNIDEETICSYSIFENEQIIVENVPIPPLGNPDVTIDVNTNIFYDDGGYNNSATITMRIPFFNVTVGSYFYQSTYNYSFQFIEFQGDSFIVFDFSQQYFYDYSALIPALYEALYNAQGFPIDLPDAQGSVNASNSVSFIIDVPDDIDFEDNYLEQFILCNPLFNQEIVDIVQGNTFVNNFNEFVSSGQITDADTIELAGQILQAFTAGTGYGVFEDNNNNTYQLATDGAPLQLTPFLVLGQQVGFTVENVYLLDEATANITNVPLDICYCDDGIQERFETWQQMNNCDSDYGNPFAFVEQYISAHYVDDGNAQYLEINFPELFNSLNNGYWEADYESILICLDGMDFPITSLCIDTEALFQNYYQNGYVNFDQLFPDAITFKDSNGQDYTVSAFEDEEGPLYCAYELEPCEILEPLNLHLINLQNDLQASSTNTSLTLYYGALSYTISFEYFHDANQTYIDMSLQQGSSEAEHLLYDILPPLDCCCGIEDFLVDVDELYDDLAAIIAAQGQVTIHDLEKSLIQSGNIAFSDCEDHCYELTIDSDDIDQDADISEKIVTMTSGVEDTHVPLSFGVETLLPNGEPIITPVETDCFDQFFDISYVQCNDIKYIDLTWHHTGFGFAATLDTDLREGNDIPSPQECFTFPFATETLRISISDTLNDCDITDIVLSPELYAQLEAYFQDCCTLSDTINRNSGQELVELLFNGGAEFISECGECFQINDILLSSGATIYELAPCEFTVDCLMPDVGNDENDLADFNFGLSFEEAFNQANTGSGLSLREAVILSNHYDYMSNDETNLICLSDIRYLTQTNSEGVGLDETIGDYDILNDVIIQGVGSVQSVVDAQFRDRAFQVDSDVTLTLLDLTVSNGRVTSVGGGGIYSLGNLIVENSIIKDNSIAEPDLSITTTVAGGGIYMVEGSITNSQVANNLITVKGGDKGFFLGGGVYAASAGDPIEITSTEISSNTIRFAADTQVGAAGEGGGLYGINTQIDNTTVANNQIYGVGESIVSFGGGLYLSNSSLTNSSVYYNDARVEIPAGFNASSAIGGGLYLNESTTVNNSTVAYNETDVVVPSLMGQSGASWGAGIYINSSNNEIINSTIYGNDADNDAPLGVSQGGGIFISQIALSTYLSNLTVTANSVSTPSINDQGAGIYNDISTTVINSTIAVGNNAVAGYDDVFANSGAEGSNNLFGNVFIFGGTITYDTSDYNTTFGSNVLASNGGPTQTVALSGTSPAIDAGLAGQSGDVDEFADQRGVLYYDDPNTTNVTDGSDIGAYELVINATVVNCLTATTNMDENDLSSFSFTTSNFAEALAQASGGAGLSLREAVILSNHYNYMDDGSTNVICLEALAYQMQKSSEGLGLNAEVGDFDLLNNVIIQGEGSDSTTVTANGLDRVFQVNTGVTVTLDSMTIANGYITQSFGGGIYSLGTLNLLNSTVSNNQIINPSNALGIGGGIYMVDGYIANSSIENNLISLTNNTYIFPAANGAGVYAIDTLIEGSSITGNTIEAEIIASQLADGMALGAGLFLSNSDVNNTTIANNSMEIAVDATLFGNSYISDGAGVYMASASSITNSTISSNESHLQVQAPTSYIGGFIHGVGVNIYGSSNEIRNTTIVDNEGIGSNAGVYGGGIFISQTGLDTTISNTTIALNQVNSDVSSGDTGGGIYSIVSNAGSPPVISSTIVVGNFSAGDLDDVNDQFNVVTGSNNLFGGESNPNPSIYDVSTYFDIFGTNTLANNGGPTETIALVLGSDAIDVGLIGAGESSDQRGASYVGQDDVGSYEFGGIVPPVILDMNKDGHIALISPEMSPVTLDQLIEGASSNSVGWVGSEDGFLMYDPEGTGEFSNINQISFTGYSKDAKTDLEGLRGFDTNMNNQLDVGDAEYDKFGVWQDTNANAKTDQYEYNTLRVLGIESISLVSDNHNILSEGNIVFGESSYKTVGGEEHIVADVGLTVANSMSEEGQPTLTMNEVVRPDINIDFTSIESDTSAVAINSAVIDVSSDAASNDCVTVPPPPTVPEVEDQPQVAA